MATTFDDEMRVTFPASSGFAAVGRVAAAGLAFRLGFDVAQVENLRLAVEQATTILSGSGSITMVGRWNDACLLLELSNPEATLSPGQIQDLEETARALVSVVAIDHNRISLTIGAAKTA